MSDVDYSGVDFINDVERRYFEEARLGIGVQQFLQSDVGRYLHGRAKITLEEVKDKMLELEPSTAGFEEEFYQLKQEAWCANKFIKWCAEGIMNGQNAEQQLESFRGNDNG